MTAKTQTLADAYAAGAINSTSTWPKDATPLTWRPGTWAGKIGCLLILKDNKRYGWYYQPPVAQYKDLPEVAELGLAPGSGKGLDPRWRRLPSELERTWSLAHSYDRNGSYLSIAGSAALPCGAPAWVEGARYTKEPGKSALAGLWHVRVDYNSSPWDGYDLPHVCPEGDDIWLWSATVRSALECGYRVEPASEYPGAILWPEQHKALGVWAAHLWAARRALETDAGGADPERFPDEQARRKALDLIKDVYAQTIGLFGKPPKENELTQEEIDAGVTGNADPDAPRWHRPEWQRTIKADAAARMFYYARKAVERGYPPLWMHADAFGFASNTTPQETADAAGLNTTPYQCGAMRHEYSVPMGELLRLSGRNIMVEGRGHKLPGVRTRHAGHKSQESREGVRP